MSFAPVQDLLDGQVSPQERFRGMLQKILQRKKNISPNPADGFYSETNNSNAEGSGVTTAQGANGQN